MKFLLSPYKSIPENMALELYFMEREGDYLILSTNEKCIVVGRNQVIYSEVDVIEQQSSKIPVYRRYSGGGTVFIDCGTLNYSLVTEYEHSRSSYTYFNDFVINVLFEAGVSNLVEKGCNIFYNNFKISGTAQYKRKNRFLHHGTLLINSNLELLQTLLKQYTCYKTSGKKSISSEVINLSSINSKFQTDYFQSWFERFLKEDKSSQKINMTDDILNFIAIRKNDFYKDIWIYGNSPEYEFDNEISLPDGSVVQVLLYVRKGKIIRQNISKNNLLSNLILIDRYHSYDVFFQVLFTYLCAFYSLNQISKVCYQFFNGEI